MKIQRIFGHAFWGLTTASLLIPLLANAVPSPLVTWGNVKSSYR
jgi:hypothetical protein